MKKVLKKIGIISLITIIVLLCLAFVGFGYLFLVPNSSLFGVRYLSDKTGKYYHLGEYNSALSEISISSGKYSVNVVVDKDVKEVQVFQKNDLSGLIQKKKQNIGLEYSKDNLNNRLTIKTKEMSGWIGYGSSYIDVILPESSVNASTTLVLSAKDKSSLSVSSNAGAKFKELRATLNRGNLTIDKIEMDNLNIVASHSNIKLGSEVGDGINYVKLDIGNSTMDFLDAGGGSVEIAKAQKENREINIDNVSFNIGKLEMVGMSSDGEVSLIKCNELTSAGYPNNRIYGGRIECLCVGDIIQYASKNCNLVLGRIEGTQKSVFDASGNGGLKVTGKVVGSLSAVSKSGSLYANQLIEVCRFETGSGSITIKNATKALQLVSDSGKVDVKFSEDIGEYGGGMSYREISLLRVKNGSVKIDGLNIVNLVVDDGGKASIKLFYKRALGISNIQSKTASLLMVVPYDEAVKIDVECKNTMLESGVGTLTHKKGRKTGNFGAVVFTGNAISEPAILIDAGEGSVSMWSDNLYGK